MARTQQKKTRSKIAKCNICKKIFSKNSNLNTHTKNIHDGRRFLCTYCSKYFQTRFSLIRHIRRIHPNMNQTDNLDEAEHYVKADTIEMSESAKNMLIKRLQHENIAQAKVIHDLQQQLKFQNKTTYQHRRYSVPYFTDVSICSRSIIEQNCEAVDNIVLVSNGDPTKNVRN